MTRVVNIADEKCDELILRPSIYSNPYPIGSQFTREQALRAYRQHLECHPEIVKRARRELSGKVLGCVCKPKPCHGDILIEFMERPQ